MSNAAMPTVQDEDDFGSDDDGVNNDSLRDLRSTAQEINMDRQQEKMAQENSNVTDAIAASQSSDDEKFFDKIQTAIDIGTIPFGGGLRWIFRKIVMKNLKDL